MYTTSVTIQRARCTIKLSELFAIIVDAYYSGISYKHTAVNSTRIFNMKPSVILVLAAVVAMASAAANRRSDGSGALLNLGNLEYKQASEFMGPAYRVLGIAANGDWTCDSTADCKQGSSSHGL
jgi:hypothetical protein